MTTEPGSVTTRISRLVDSVTFENVPPESVDEIERVFVDTVGVTYGGLASGAGARLARALDSDAGAVPIPGIALRTTPTDAAFITGIAAHTLDFDDSVPSIPAHVSCVVVPAILAAGSTVEASGRDAIAAYLAGYETIIALGRVTSPMQYDRGWHPTGTLGGFGAAAAAAHVFDLDTTETEHALGLAASMASGIRANYGSDGKPMHAGAAARTGVTAALAASEGTTATAGALDGENGFFDLYGGSGSPPLAIDTLSFPQTGVFRKQYPCCHCAHAPIAAVASIVSNEDIDANAIEQIRVSVSEMAAFPLETEFPTTADEARFSLSYLLGCAVVDGSVGFDDFEPGPRDDPNIRRVAERVRLDVDHTRDEASLQATVELTTTTGRTIRRENASPPGSPENPMSSAAIAEKFQRCRRRLDDVDRDGYRSLATLRERSSIRSLVAWL